MKNHNPISKNKLFLKYNKWSRDDGPPQRYPDPISPLTENLLKSYRCDALNNSFKKLPLPQHEGDVKLETFSSYLYWNVESRTKIRKNWRLIIFLIKLVRSIYLSLPEYYRIRDICLLNVEKYNLILEKPLSNTDLLNHFLKFMEIDKKYFTYEVYIGLTGEIFLEIAVNIISSFMKLKKDYVLKSLSTSNITYNLLSDLNQIVLFINNDILLTNYFVKSSIYEISKNIFDENRFPSLSHEFTKFFKKYGHRRFKADWYYPSISEDPSILIATIKKNIQIMQDDLHRDCMPSVDSVKIPISANYFINKLYSKALEWFPIHEERQHYCNYLDDTIRKYILKIGERLINNNILENKKEIFFLSLDEIKMLMSNNIILDKCNFKNKIIFRINKWETAFFNDPLYVINKSNESAATKEPEYIEGLPVSSGKIKGFALVLKSLDKLTNLDLIKFDILVTRSTNPSWFPLINISKGIVTDYGGMLSHSAIIARELQIPAVVSTQIGTSLISTGQFIEVDGNNGLVKLFNKEDYDNGKEGNIS